jgi:hypothetical protein
LVSESGRRKKAGGEGGAPAKTAWWALKTGPSAAGDGIYDVEVTGGGGSERIGLYIEDAFACQYRGLFALLDGGLGKNTLDPVILGPAANVKRLNV